jgi:hypothetical protein
MDPMRTSVLHTGKEGGEVEAKAHIGTFLQLLTDMGRPVQNHPSCACASCAQTDSNSTLLACCACRKQPNEPVAYDVVAKLGVRFWNLAEADVNDPEGSASLSAIRAKHDYPVSVSGAVVCSSGCQCKRVRPAGACGVQLHSPCHAWTISIVTPCEHP